MQSNTSPACAGGNSHSSCAKVQAQKGEFRLEFDLKRASSGRCVAANKGIAACSEMDLVERKVPLLMGGTAAVLGLLFLLTFDGWWRFVPRLVLLGFSAIAFRIALEKKASLRGD